MIGLIRPWNSQWVEPLKTLSCQPRHEEWLFIAWTLGDQVTYRKVAQRLLVHCSVSSNGHLLGLDEQPLGNALPLGAIGKYS